MTEKYSKEARRLIVARHEAVHTTVAYLLGLPLVAVSRDGKTDCGATLVDQEFDSSSTESMVAECRKRLMITRATFLEADEVAEWADGDRAASAGLVRALTKRFGKTAADAIVLDADASLKTMMRSPEYIAVQGAISRELLSHLRLTGPEILLMADKARPPRVLKTTSPASGRISRVRGTPRPVVKLSEKTLRGSGRRLQTERAKLRREAAAAQAANLDWQVADAASKPKGKPKSRAVTPVGLQDQREAERREMELLLKLHEHSLRMARAVAEPDTSDAVVDSFVRQTKAIDARAAAEAVEQAERIRALNDPNGRQR
jgi:hypothetical protein